MGTLDLAETKFESYSGFRLTLKRLLERGVGALFVFQHSGHCPACRPQQPAVALGVWALLEFRVQAVFAIARVGSAPSLPVKLPVRVH